MSNKRIRAAFERVIAEWAEINDYRVAYENRKFKPTQDTYLKTALLPAQTVSRDMAGEHRQYKGVFQVLIYATLAKGASEAETLAKALDDLFPLTAPLTDSDTPALQVFLLTPMSAAAPIDDPARFILPVSCTYQADVI